MLNPRRRLNLVLPCRLYLFCFASVAPGFAQAPVPLSTPSPAPGTGETLSPVTVTATREETALERSPSSTTVISNQQIDERQYRFVTDALRSVPGLTVSQTGTPGQLTSVFTRGTRSDQTEVLLDGIPVNQSLSGAFNFADLTTDNLQRIEVVRGSQSALYGGRASGGVINLITKHGLASPQASGLFEGGSYDSFRESATSNGRLGMLDYAVGASRFDTQNARENNEYRNTSFLGDFGLQVTPQLRLGVIALYGYADTGSPGTIFNPKPYDNLRTERYQLAPIIDFDPVDWWHHRFYFSYDQERQINNPNRDGFTGPTRGIFRRNQLEYENELTPVSWLSLITGLYYAHANAYQERPEILFGSPLVRDKTENLAGFGQINATPLPGLDLYLNGRYDTFRDYGDKLTYRLACNYRFAPTQTILRASYGTGFTPPSSQDKIFGNNPDLKPDRERAYDVGFEQPLWEGRLRFGANYFHETTTNEIGINPDFVEFNLGSARSQGVELFANWRPVPGLTLAANYTYLDAENTGSHDINQPAHGRLIRLPRNKFYASASYVWFDRITTSVEVETVNARQDRAYDAFGNPYNFDIEDYTTVRLTAEWRVTAWLKLTGRIENLFDEKYAVVYGYPALGRTFYGGVTARF